MGEKGEGGGERAAVVRENDEWSKFFNFVVFTYFIEYLILHPTV